MSRVRVLVPNDTNSINDDIEYKQKLNRLSKLNLRFEEESVPFPPRTVRVNIAM